MVVTVAEPQDDTARFEVFKGILSRYHTASSTCEANTSENSSRSLQGAFPIPGEETAPALGSTGP